MSENSKIEGRICVTLMEHTLLWQMNRDEQAARVMEALERLVDCSAQFFLPNLAAYKTRLKLLDGDLASARDWLEQYFVVETDHIELYRDVSALYYSQSPYGSRKNREGDALS